MPLTIKVNSLPNLMARHSRTETLQTLSMIMILVKNLDLEKVKEKMLPQNSSKLNLSHRVVMTKTSMEKMTVKCTMVN